MADYDVENQKKRLRRYLNPTIAGPNTDIILEALATGAGYLVQSVEAVNDQLYIATAVDRYLDSKLSERNLSRPEELGLSDDIFRQIGIEVTNKSQVRDLINKILEIMFGQEFTRATLASNLIEPYNLNDGDSLMVSYNDGPINTVTFKANEFGNINTATAQEVSDAITRGMRQLGQNGSAFIKNDGFGNYVNLISDANGASSTVKVLGGNAQNALKFPQIRGTTPDITTQWTLSLGNGGRMRATWTGGPNPSLGRVLVGDYINIYGLSFGPSNRGTFNIDVTVSGTVGNAYVEFSNPSGIPEVVVQGTLNAILFYQPLRSSVLSKLIYAAAYQSSNRLLEVYMPATTRVIRRDRIGSAHVIDEGSSGTNYGPYIYDESKPYIISGDQCNTTEAIGANSGLVITVDDASAIPDARGFLCFGFGTSKEEGPVPYISRPSDGTLMIDPSYRFKYTHKVGTNIQWICQNSIYLLPGTGISYPFYITDVVSGTSYAEQLVNYTAATGISVIVYILYSNDIGLGKWGTKDSEKFWVFGQDMT